MKTDDKKITKQNTKAVKKTSKNVKTVPAKKLPKLLKKTYTQKQLDKKIYGKLFIPDDIKYLKSLFKENGKNKKDITTYAIPSDLLFEKKEISRLKTISKEIKENKSRIRWAPLIAVVTFITASVVVLTLTKNTIARKVITNTCESIFEAKCDISTINISFFNSNFKLTGLQIADKNNPMKNLFSVDSITFDFDMLQLLKARFVANELSILGVDTNTDRTYSGDITAKKQAKIQKKKQKQAEKDAKQNQDSVFMTALEQKKDVAIGTLKDSVTGLFDQYNPQTIINNCYSQLQTPQIAKQTQEDVTNLVNKYKAKPQQIEEKINKAKETTQKAASIDINSIKSDPLKIKEALDTINQAKTSIDSLKKETETTFNDINKDANSVTQMSSNLTSAITHDKNLVSDEISKITSLNLNDGKQFISGTFDSIIYQVLGKYYPYYVKALDLINNSKNKKASQDNTKKEKKVSTIVKRNPGRNVYYKNDSSPKFLIKKAAGSGPNFSFDAVNITNEMDKTGTPAKGNVSILLNEITHKAGITVDTRSNTTNPLVYAQYSCDNIPLSYPSEKFGNIPGIPGVDSSNSTLNFDFKVFEDEGFSISGTSDFSNLKLSAPKFEPEFASNIYADTLSKINSMKLGVEAGFTKSGGIDLKLITDIDKQFMNALSKEMSEQLTKIKESTQTEIIAKINDLSGGALGQINDFNDISNKINSYQQYIDNLSNQFEEKKKELEVQSTNKINSLKDDAINSAKSSLKNLF